MIMTCRKLERLIKAYVSEVYYFDQPFKTISAIP